MAHGSDLAHRTIPSGVLPEAAGHGQKQNLGSWTAVDMAIGGSQSAPYCCPNVALPPRTHEAIWLQPHATVCPQLHTASLPEPDTPLLPGQSLMPLPAPRPTLLPKHGSVLPPGLGPMLLPKCILTPGAADQEGAPVIQIWLGAQAELDTHGKKGLAGLT